MRHTIAITAALVTALSFTSIASNAYADSGDDIDPIQTELSELEESLVNWVDARFADMIEELTKHVEHNTGTLNVDGLDRYRDLLAQELKALGFAVTTHSAPSLTTLSCSGGELHFADHLEARRHADSNSPKLLLNGHMDTVFAVDDEFQRLQILPDGTLKGPA